MKKLYLLAGAALALAMASCSEQDFPTPSAANIPQASNYADAIKIDIDPETNQVTFTLDAPAVMPVWIIDGTKYSTVNGMKQIYATAGDYEIEMKVLNSNGISDGSVYKTFHIENSIVDYTKYLTLLSGDGIRQWRMASEEAAHLGCGEPGTDGTNWWAAQPGEKADCGLYDNRLMFDKEYNYTFNPGDAGVIYVNKDVTRFAGFENGAEADYNVSAQEQTTKYTFEVQGADLFLVLEKGAFFPYIANNDVYDAPRYKVKSITASALELISDNGGIAWHYLFTSKADNTPKPFTGFKYDTDFNLWKSCNINNIGYYYAPGWSQIADPETTVSEDKSTITIKLPAATSDQWQAQVHFDTDLSSTSAVQYDFSVVVTVSKDHPGVTIKLTDATDDGNFFMADRIAMKAYEDYVYYFSDKQGIDAANLNLFFDFGGCADDTEVTIKNIVFKDHANDDGTVLPSDEPGIEPGGVIWAGVDDPANLMTTGELSLASCWWADNNWSQVSDPTVAIEGRNVTITATTDNGGNQWQGQVHLNTGVAIEEGKVYDFSITINAGQDLGGATVKPHPEGDDGHFFSEARHDLTAYEDVVITYENITADFSTSNLVITLDFPGCAQGTVIEVKDIIIQEHNESAPAVGGNWVDVDSADNLMTTGTFALASCWWADNNWAQIADPTVTVNGREAIITATTANGGNQWQGQVHFNTGVAMAVGTVYDFSITLNASQDLGGATVKPHPAGDDGHFISEGRHDLPAYEDAVITYENFASDFSTENLVITLDFPGCAQGTVIEVKDIILQIHK